ncbi:hypothetical protein LEP1GSC186_3734 [Leptospira noguchii serovar Autumnalis str. ZUN142]|uniref:Uncharacterized protein n=1 Tax=Leptospira noguchii serovar Autumnalis str. ZUN142 TaxID=1085540 RepID=M6U3S1_9LEPT|nr:hypothetical protein LEP1GSC186_3734 [Leptospira noguchii serovar Autumnalis str. ZUN142]
MEFLHFQNFSVKLRFTRGVPTDFVFCNKIDFYKTSFLRTYVFKY